MATNSIDSFNFVSLMGPGGGDQVETVYQHGEIQQRVGIDGTALIQTGTRGDPFQLESLVDVDTFVNAQALRILYKSIVNAGLVVVICAGVNYYNPIGHKYFVLDVRSRARRVTAATGGLLGNGQAIVEAIWTLVPVYVGYP